MERKYGRSNHGSHRYNNTRSYGDKSRFSRGSTDSHKPEGSNSNAKKGYGGDKKCYVCGEADCWSTKHTKEERAISYNKFRNTSYFVDSHREPTPESFQQFLLQWEGQPPITDDEFAQSLIQMEIWHTTAQTEFDGIEAIALLRDRAVHHAITKKLASRLLRSSPTIATPTISFRVSSLIQEQLVYRQLESLNIALCES